MKNLRKVITLFLALTMVLTTFINTTINVQAASKGRIDMFIDNEKVETYTGSGEPFIENGRTLVPVRIIAEAMGAEVGWENETQKVSLEKVNNFINYDGKTYNNAKTIANLQIGSSSINIALIDETGKEIFNVTKAMDIKAKIVEERTYIPARFVGYALGYSVNWNEANYSVEYTFIGTQTTDFQLENVETPEPNNKYNEEWVWHKPQLPLSKPPYEFHYPARKGYGDILIIDGSKGNIDKETGVRPSTLPGYDITPVNVIIESDEEKYDLNNNITPEENLKRFVSLYEDKTGNEVTLSHEAGNYALKKLGYFTTYLDYTNSGIIGKVTDFELENKNYYWIDSRSIMADTSMFYSYTDSGTTTACYSDHTPRSESGSKNMLFVLNEFLGETGQKIWTLMHDYYNHTNHFYYPPNTLWPTGVGNISKAITKEDCEKYGLNFIDCKFIKTTHHYKFTIKTEKQYIHILFLPLLDYGQALGGYVVLFDEIE